MSVPRSMFAQSLPAPAAPSYAAGRSAARRSASAGAIFAACLLAIPFGGFVGVLLGWWCRASVGDHSVAGVLAELGAPWIAAAFFSGASVMLLTTGWRSTPALGAAAAGALAGSTCLVAATIVYYGPARTGRFDVSGAGSAVVVWTAVGIAVGLAFGALGAMWWGASSRAQAALCLVAVGTAITSEAYYLLDAGAGHDDLIRNVLVAVAIAGAALPLLLGARWQAVAGIALVAILAFPGSIVAEIVSRGAIDTMRHLRHYVGS